MLKNKKITILIAALMFSVGMISIGYGFWTDSLELEGNSDVRIILAVTNDMTDPVTSPEAVELKEEPTVNSDSSGDLSDDNTNETVIQPQPSTTLPDTEVTIPDQTDETAETGIAPDVSADEPSESEPSADNSSANSETTQ